MEDEKPLIIETSFLTKYYRLLDSLVVECWL